MSYLDVPRIHFSGQFFADPSTVNNSVASHNNVGAVTPAWNAGGRHHFDLRNCTITSGVDGGGAVKATTADDRAVGGVVRATAATGMARLVDLDPDHQTGSQIWGLGIEVRDTAGIEGFTATMETASLRELWMRRRPGGMSGFGGTYQSVLTSIVWAGPSQPMGSPLLDLLRTNSVNRLSIRFVTWAYNPNSAAPDFCLGQIVGTIGPADASEPAHFVAARRVVDAGTSAPVFAVPVNSSPFNTAPFKLDMARRRVVVDLGNALPEDAAGARQPIGALRAEIVNSSGPPTVLGSAAIPNSAASFRVNAGVEEIALSVAEASALAIRGLRFRAGPNIVLAERGSGIHVDVEDTVVRLNPGETKDIELVVTQKGRPMATANVHVGPSLATGRPAALTALSIRTGAPAFGTTLTTLPAVVRTGANGKVTIRLVAANPGHPRPDVDGQVSWIGFYIGATATAANQRGEIAVRVYDTHPVPATPRLADVQQIVRQYSRLYPSMRAIFDLDNHATVVGVAPRLAQSMRRPVTNGNFMPVTRDLSLDKTQLLLKWFDAGAPA